MNASLPALFATLKDPTTGTYPDLRIALIDSDLGTGGAYPSGTCGPNERNGYNNYGDLGRFQMRGATGCGVTSPDALWLEYANGRPINYDATRDIHDVLACLVTNLGTASCGEEHHLQAFEFALAAHDIGNEAQQKMLRPYAQLALVFLAEEDDCSAATNDGMFGDKPELRGESAGLRCATRGHQCGGVNLTTAPPGYPTTAAFSAPLASCKARMDACPNQTDGDLNGTDTSGPTPCSPLKSIKVVADRMKALKPGVDQKVSVAGIFGWPRNQEEMASAMYRIDLVPNPNSADLVHPQVFDLWPACHDPSNLPRNSDDPAWGWAGMPGLRLASFVDEFGSNGLKFSICEPDYKVSLTAIGTALARRLRGSCISAAVSQYADCQAHVEIPNGVGGYVPQPVPVPSCEAAPDSVPCYTLAADATACAADEYRVGLNPPSYVTTSTILRLACK